MKTVTRHLMGLSALGAMLALAGCTTTQVPVRTPVARQIAPAGEFTVVDSSLNRPLTPPELAQLRESVSNYLSSHGEVQPGDYYVRVDFSPTDPGTAGEWVVVKLTNQAAPNYTLLAAYPAIGPDDYYPYGFSGDPAYEVGFSPWYDTFGAPVYYYSNYHTYPTYPVPTFHIGDNRRDRDHNPSDKPRQHRFDHQPDGNNTGNVWRHDRGDHPNNEPFRPNHPRVEPTNNGSGTGDHGHYDHTTRPTGSSRDNRSSGSTNYSRGQSSGGSNNHSYSAPAPQSYSAPAPQAAPATNNANTRNSENNPRFNGKAE